MVVRASFKLTRPYYKPQRENASYIFLLSIERPTLLHDSLVRTLSTSGVGQLIATANLIFSVQSVDPTCAKKNIPLDINYVYVCMYATCL